MYYVHKDYSGSWLCITNSSGAVAQERSFGACMQTVSRFHREKVGGRRRNPSDWSYTGLPSSYKFSRGYTNHEYLDKFGLINMPACHIPISSGGGRNGRMYDPVVGRFLSPDNFVQTPGFTQSYNRYAYCLNNPLKYTDPSGEKWKWWQVALLEVLTGGGVSITSTIAGTTILTTAIGAQTTAQTIDLMVSSTKMSINLVKDIFNPGDHIYEDDSWIFEDMFNWHKIEFGMINQTRDMFRYDKSATGEEKFMQTINTLFGGELLQTMVGNSFAHLQNIRGNIDKIGYYEGRTTIRVKENSFKKYSGVSHGHYLFGEEMALNPNDTEYDVDLFAHEFGHTYQSRIAGPSYYLNWGIPSGLLDKDYPEDDADYRAHENLGIWPHTDYWGNPIITETTRMNFWDLMAGPFSIFWYY